MMDSGLRGLSMDNEGQGAPIGKQAAGLASRRQKGVMWMIDYK